MLHTSPALIGALLSARMPPPRTPCVRASATDAAAATSALASMHYATLKLLVTELQVEETTNEYVASTGFDSFTLSNGQVGTVQSFEPLSASSKVAWCSVSSAMASDPLHLHRRLL